MSALIHVFQPVNRKTPLKKIPSTAAKAINLSANDQIHPL
jgi:hypothetical protein